MKALFENIIKTEDYDLTQLTHKIEEFYVRGKLTATERDELLVSLRAAPKVQFDTQKEIRELWSRIKTLEKKLADAPANAEVIEWKQPTGGHDAYAKGDRVKYVDGKIYESVIDGNVWSPDVYPAGWQLV